MTGRQPAAGRAAGPQPAALPAAGRSGLVIERRPGAAPAARREAAAIDWLEISGAPTDEQRRLIRAAVEQYLAGEQPAPEPAWRRAGPPVRQPGTGWGAGRPWNGLL